MRAGHVKVTVTGCEALWDIKVGCSHCAEDFLDWVKKLHSPQARLIVQRHGNMDIEGLYLISWSVCDRLECICGFECPLHVFIL